VGEGNIPGPEELAQKAKFNVLATVSAELARARDPASSSAS
jgi:hypothetical protein